MQETERPQTSATDPSLEAPQARPWLIRIDVNFENLADEVLNSFGAISCARLGEEYYLIKTYIPEAIRESTAAQFARWNMPVEHSWPCNPARMDGFIEKAAQAMWKKFGPRKPQSILMGPLVPGSRDPYYKDLASNLRGRTLQLFPPSRVKHVEEQNVDQPTLFALVGREGLFCGMQSPRLSNGFHPGGSRFISLSSPGTISRAGGKIAEALHYLRLYRPSLPEESHWLELGACPGGMTSELLAKGYRVTAIDRAPLDPRVLKFPNLEFIHADVLDFNPPKNASYDAILCDMNGPPHEAMQQVVRLAKNLRRQGLVVFTLKFSRVERVQDPLTLFKNLTKLASEGGLKLFAQTHLTYNGYEFTMFLEKVK